MSDGWDTTIALAYAAEELVFAAQALTSDVMTPEHRLSVAHRHLLGLLQHDRYLPLKIGMRLRNLNGVYMEWENHSDSGRPKRRDNPTTETMKVLRDVRDLLREQEHILPLAA